MNQARNLHDGHVPWQPCEGLGWRRVQLKHFFEIRLGKMLQNAPVGSQDRQVPYLRAMHVQWNSVGVDDPPVMWASDAEIVAFSIRRGDLLVCEGGEVGRGAIVETDPPEDCIIQNALHRVRARGAASLRYLRYMLMHAADHEWFDVLCNRATIAHFTGDKFGEMRAWLPPLPTQRAIADYLDRETGQIDSLVAAKQRLLDILAEKRQALITRAVTRGLDSNVPMRDSGIPWLGEMPAHWQVRRFATLFKERDERGEPDLPLLVVSLNTGVTAREFGDDRIERVAEDFNSYKIARKGDIAFNKMRMWQGAVGISPTDGLVSPDYVVAYPIADFCIDYFGTLLRIPAMSAEFARHSHGIVWDRLRLYWEDFRDVYVPLPPLDEQRAIAAYIARETARIDALRDTAQRSIDLLKERRAALIAAAVTGQIEIPVPEGVADEHVSAH